MKTSRIKWLVILILAITNLCLSSLWVQQLHRKQQAEQVMWEQLTLLYQNHGIALSAPLPSAEAPVLYTLSVTATMESSLLQTLLGGDYQTEQGSGYQRYSSALGECRYYANGHWQLHLLPSLSFSQVQTAFTEKGRYRTLRETPSFWKGSQENNGIPILNCIALLSENEDGSFSSDGLYAPLAGYSVSDTELLSPITALTLFLDYHNTSGQVCTNLHGLSYGYWLESYGTLQLLPVLQVETDGGQYAIFLTDGRISKL